MLVASHLAGMAAGPAGLRGLLRQLRPGGGGRGPARVGGGAGGRSEARRSSPGGNRTRATRLKTSRANRYTTGPCHPFYVRAMREHMFVWAGPRSMSGRRLESSAAKDCPCERSLGAWACPLRPRASGLVTFGHRVVLQHLRRAHGPVPGDGLMRALQSDASVGELPRLASRPSELVQDLPRGVHARARGAPSPADPAARERRRAHARDFVLRLLSTGSCADCGLTDPLVLEFDHVAEKTLDVAKLVHEGYSLSRIELEVSRCEIVCVNCHRRRTARRSRTWRVDPDKKWALDRPLRRRNLEYVLHPPAELELH